MRLVTGVGAAARSLQLWPSRARPLLLLLAPPSPPKRPRHLTQPHSLSTPCKPPRMRRCPAGHPCHRRCRRQQVPRGRGEGRCLLLPTQRWIAARSRRRCQHPHRRRRRMSRLTGTTECSPRPSQAAQSGVSSVLLSPPSLLPQRARPTRRLLLPVLKTTCGGAAAVGAAAMAVAAPSLPPPSSEHRPPPGRRRSTTPLLRGRTGGGSSRARP